VATSPAGSRNAAACGHATVRGSWRALMRDVERYLVVRNPRRLERHGMLRRLGAVTSNEMMGLSLHRLSHLIESSRPVSPDTTG
jgi:hypothetical protein